MAGILLGGCGPLDRPRVELGDPVQNVVEVSFTSEIEGTGELRWEAGGVEHVVPAGEGRRFVATVLLPSGRTSALTGRVRGRNGSWTEGPTRRVHLPKAPAKVRFEVEELDPARSALGDGLILLNLYDDTDSYAIAIDRLGDVRWWIEPDRDDQRILRIRPGLDGRSIVLSRWAERHQVDPDDGWITRWTLEAEAERTDTRALAFHHDFVELPEGGFGWLSWVYDEDGVVGGEAGIPVAADAIRVAEEGAAEGEEEVVYDLLTDYPEPVFWSCAHMAPGGFVGGDWREWSHANSIAYDASTESFRMLARYWDAVLEIGRDGTLHWQAGGRYSDLELVGWFRHGHASELTGDRLVVFDNGNHGEPPIVSSVVGLDLDLEAGEVREAWRIEDPQGEFTDFLGDVRTLPGGNLLVLYSPSARIEEYTPSGELVWRATLDNGMRVGRMTWTDQLRPGG